MDVNTHWQIVSWRIIIWRFAIDPPTRQIKIPAKFTGYTVCLSFIFLLSTSYYFTSYCHSFHFDLYLYSLIIIIIILFQSG